MAWVKNVVGFSWNFRSITEFHSFSTFNVKPRYVFNRTSCINFATVSNQQIMIDSIGGQFKGYKKNEPAEQIKVLKDVLYIRSTKAYRILKKYPKLVTCDMSTLSMNIHDMRERGMTDERILAMPWLLALGKKTAEEKFELVRKALKIHTFVCAAPFLEMPIHRLHQIGALWQSELDSSISIDGKHFENRTDYLAAKLMCENTEVADMMVKAAAIMSSPLPIIDEKLKVLLDYGVEPEDIVRDPYVFTFSAHAIEKRLKSCQAEGLNVIKPWMLRCTRVAFNLYVQRVNEEADLRQGHKDIVDFLKDKLGCQASEVKEILTRVPSVKTASAIKLNEMIQFLYSHGFTASQIIEAPRVLGHSVETIDERIIELSSYGYSPQFLNVLCQTSTNYASFIRRLMPSKSSPSESMDKLSIN